MPTLPSKFIETLNAFRPHFSARVWEHAHALLIGAILARGQRTISSVLRVMGLGDETRFVNSHRVLSRAVWDARAVGRSLLMMILETFEPKGDILVGGDETIERRTGEKIRAKGIYRDPVRSSRGHFVKASGIRWVTMMVVAHVPFAARMWALPFLTLLAPSERYYKARRRHKTVVDWMRQGLLQLRRWLPHRKIIFVADNTYAALNFLHSMARLANPITVVVRGRMDMALFEPAPVRSPGKPGRTRCKGERLPSLTAVLHNPATPWTRFSVPLWYGQRNRFIEITSSTAVWYRSGHPAVPLRWVILRDPLGRFDPQVLLCTCLLASPTQIIEWFIRRWQLEVTHREVREHLGVESQRQWTDKAIARTTPALFGTYTLIALLAHHLAQAKRGALPIRRTAWYDKPTPTFCDALAAVRHAFWRHPQFHRSRINRDITKIPLSTFERFADALCYSS